MSDELSQSEGKIQIASSQLVLEMHWFRANANGLGLKSRFESYEHTKYEQEWHFPGNTEWKESKYGDRALGNNSGEVEGKGRKVIWKTAYVIDQEGVMEAKGENLYNLSHLGFNQYL